MLCLNIYIMQWLFIYFNGFAEFICSPDPLIQVYGLFNSDLVKSTLNFLDTLR